MCDDCIIVCIYCLFLGLLLWWRNCWIGVIGLLGWKKGLLFWRFLIMSICGWCLFRLLNWLVWFVWLCVVICLCLNIWVILLVKVCCLVWCCVCWRWVGFILIWCVCCVWCSFFCNRWLLLWVRWYILVCWMIGNLFLFCVLV